MDRSEYKGSITVFLSLTCILFLSLICAAAESARVQGAKTQTANIMGMGNFSVMGEFEKELLEQYEIFGLDGSYGSGEFQSSKVEERLKNYLILNTNPKGNYVSGLCFDPWNLTLEKQKVEKYALLTDEKGEPFYQQTVAFMKENMEYFAIDLLKDYFEKSKSVQEYQKQYELTVKENDGKLSDLEGQRQQKLDEIKAAEKNPEEGEENRTSQENGAVQAMEQAQSIKNPLTEIKKLRKKSTLELVTWDKKISEKKLGKALPSKGGLKKGTMKLEKQHSGLVSNLLFREYLMLYFPSYVDQEQERPVEYQAEYLIAGKSTDEANLKYVVNRLLLLREGFNYLYCLGNRQISSQANALAASLTGFLGIPALTAATGQAIMLAWAYGESLVDVRILLDGGKVPLTKDAGSWSLSLENLARLTEILQQGASEDGDGLDYEEYLRILLHLGTLSNQKMRGLDLIQTELQITAKLPQFRVQNCMVGMKTSAGWNCGTVFLRLPMAVMGVKGGKTAFSQEGSIQY